MKLTNTTLHRAPALALGVLLLLGMGACASDDDRNEVLTSGFALSVDFLGGTDVAGVSVAIERVACDTGDAFEPYNETVVVALEDMFLPDDPAYGDNPFAAVSTHLFGDAFFWLASGCYDVELTPVDAQDAPSEDCTGASELAVEVIDGQVTEITLVMQCEGPEYGGLDVAGTINHPPVIDLVTYEPSKFVLMCEPATLCLYASDPDGDPLEIVWSGPEDITVVSSENTPGYAMSCVEVIVEEEGTAFITAMIYDLYPDGADGWLRIEDLVAPEESHDSIELPLHVAWCDPEICCLAISPEPPDPPCTDLCPPPPCTDSCPPVEEEGCTLTQGFWKNHAEAWPIPTDTYLCRDTWMEILHTPPARGDVWLILAHQWIAAQLNVASGASTTPEVEAALAALYIAACEVQPEARWAALAAAEILDEFNNGLIGPGHCDDLN